MSNPFKVGDTVYHAVLPGKALKVINVGHCHVTAEHVTTTKVTGEDKEFSFYPWPAPNHTRPREAGWWVVTRRVATTDPLIRYYNPKSENVEGPVGSYRGEATGYIFHNYLGKDWK